MNEMLQHLTCWDFSKCDDSFLTSLKQHLVHKGTKSSSETHSDDFFESYFFTFSSHRDSSEVWYFSSNGKGCAAIGMHSMPSVFLLFEKSWTWWITVCTSQLLSCSSELKSAPWSSSNIIQYKSIVYSERLKFGGQKEHCPGFVSQRQRLLSARGIRGNEPLLVLSKVWLTAPINISVKPHCGICLPEVSTECARASFC